MILNTKYKFNTAAFYKNRFFRLYPIYFSVIIIIMAIGISSQIIFGTPLNNWNAIFINIENGILSVPSGVFLIFSNISMMFQDIVMFLKIQNGNFVPGYFGNSSPPIHTMLLVPQAWSLSLEIIFYAIAPFIVRNKKRILIAMTISISIRMFLHLLGHYNDPFSYRFFPSEISVFLLGSISWHIYQSDRLEIVTKYIMPIQIGIVSVFIFWPYLFSFSDIERYLFFIFFAFIIPYLFKYSENNIIDMRIGELSYPFYLSHILSIQLCSFIFSKMLGNSISSAIVTVVMATVVATLISIMLLIFIQSHFERLRRSIIQKMTIVTESSSNKAK